VSATASDGMQAAHTPAPMVGYPQAGQMSPAIETTSPTSAHSTLQADTLRN
jgi:hypothetical protein